MNTHPATPALADALANAFAMCDVYEEGTTSDAAVGGALFATVRIIYDLGLMDEVCEAAVDQLGHNPAAHLPTAAEVEDFYNLVR